jgi:antitoxin (DNA-binding transcriptional repressor) of toxin-antitoxin stability system
MNVKKTINIAAKTPLSQLTEEASPDDAIIVKNGKPIANLIGVANSDPTLPRIGFGLAWATGTGPKSLEAFNSDDSEIAALFEGEA